MICQNETNIAQVLTYIMILFHEEKLMPKIRSKFGSETVDNVLVSINNLKKLLQMIPKLHL